MDEIPELNAIVGEPIWHKNGLRVYFIYNFDENRAMLAIDVQENTTLRQILESWNAIIEYRQEFFRGIGSDLSMEDSVLYELMQFKERMSWTQLAKYVNYHSLVLLYCHYKEKDRKVYTFGWFCLLTYYLAFNFGYSKFEKWLNEAVISFDQEELPWNLSSGPFPKMRIRDQIRNLQGRIDEHKITIVPKHQNPQSIRNEENYLYTNGYYQQVNEIIQQLDPNGWSVNEGWITERIELIQNRPEPSE